MSAEIMDAVDVPERITHGELVYFKKVVEQLAQADQYEAEAARLLQTATKLRGAHESWVTHLVEQYGLDPDHHNINPEDGTIRRNGSS